MPLLLLLLSLCICHLGALRDWVDTTACHWAPLTGCLSSRPAKPVGESWLHVSYADRHLSSDQVRWVKLQEKNNKSKQLIVPFHAVLEIIDHNLIWMPKQTWFWLTRFYCKDECHCTLSMGLVPVGLCTVYIHMPVNVTGMKTFSKNCFFLALFSFQHSKSFHLKDIVDQAPLDHVCVCLHITINKKKNNEHLPFLFWPHLQAQACSKNSHVDNKLDGLKNKNKTKQTHKCQES